MRTHDVRCSARRPFYTWAGGVIIHTPRRTKQISVFLDLRGVYPMRLVSDAPDLDIVGASELGQYRKTNTIDAASEQHLANAIFSVAMKVAKTDIAHRISDELVGVSLLCCMDVQRRRKISLNHFQRFSTRHAWSHHNASNGGYTCWCLQFEHAQT